MSSIAHIRKNAERITLVPATADHAQILHDIFNGINTQKHCPVSRSTVDELRLRLERGGAAFTERAPFYRFFGEVDGVPFGTFIVKNIRWTAARAEIGTSLLDAWQGQGLGSALVYKCVRKLFEESALERVWATVSVTNDVCNRLMHRLGFVCCGHYREAFLINGIPVNQLVYEMNREQAEILATTDCPERE